MMAKSDDDNRLILELGCAEGCWSLVVNTLWCVIVYGIISAIDSPPWLLVCYWVYVIGKLCGVVIFAGAAALAKTVQP